MRLFFGSLPELGEKSPDDCYIHLLNLVSKLIYFYKGGLGYTEAINMPLWELFNLCENSEIISRGIEAQTAKNMRSR